MFMKDQKGNKLDKREVMMTIISMVAFVLIISVMGWSSVEKYNSTPLPTTIDNAHLIRLSTSELARQTVLINEELKRRAQK